MPHTDLKEIEQFSKHAAHWWDEQGPLQGLHAMNPARLQFIKHHLCRHFNRDENSKEPFKGLSFCDVGCGGGILTEPLTRLGAKMTGIDASEEAIAIAKQHAQSMKLKIDYQLLESEGLLKKKKKFDAVLSLEVVEHVANLQAFLSECSGLIKPEGALILSTLNKTWKAWALGIVVAENILKWAPKGAHDWNKFVSPQDLAARLRDEDVETLAVEGINYCPTQGWRLGSNIDINYILYGKKV